MQGLRMASTAPRIALVLGILGVSCLLAACSSEPRLPKVEVTAEQLDAQAERDLKQYSDAVLAKNPNAELPNVERVRFITLDEWAATIATCLTEEGFDATADQGALSSTAPERQEEPYLIAQYVCNARFPLDPHQMMPLVDDQIRYLYDYYVQVATPCLEGMGFSVPDPPSLQTYVDGYRDAPDWRPYEDASIKSTDEQWARIQEECPERAPGMFGELTD